MKNKKTTFVSFISMAIVFTVAFGALIPHPNSFYKSKYVVLAKDLDLKKSKILRNKLEKELLSYEVSADRKTIKITEKAKMHFTFEGGDIRNIMSLKQKVIVQLIQQSAHLKTIFWEFIYRPIVS